MKCMLWRTLFGRDQPTTQCSFPTEQLICVPYFFVSHFTLLHTIAPFCGRQFDVVQVYMCMCDIHSSYFNFAFRKSTDRCVHICLVDIYFAIYFTQFKSNIREVYKYTKTYCICSTPACVGSNVKGDIRKFVHSSYFNFAF